jgi:hypothetical protein
MTPGERPREIRKKKRELKRKQEKAEIHNEGKE